MPVGVDCVIFAAGLFEAVPERRTTVGWTPLSIAPGPIVAVTIVAGDSCTEDCALRTGGRWTAHSI